MSYWLLWFWVFVVVILCQMEYLLFKGCTITCYNGEPGDPVVECHTANGANQGLILRCAKMCPVSFSSNTH